MSLAPFSWEVAFREGAPATPASWLPAAMFAAFGFACAAWVADVARAPRVRWAFELGFALAGAAVFASLISTAEEGRRAWSAQRFVRGDPYPPWFALRAQLLHTRLTAVIALALTAVATFIVARRSAWERHALGAAAFCCALAAGLAVSWLSPFGGRASPEDIVDSSDLPMLAEHARLASVGAFIFTAVVGVIAARRGPAPRARSWAGLLAWVSAGLVLWAPPAPSMPTWPTRRRWRRDRAPTPRIGPRLGRSCRAAIPRRPPSGPCASGAPRSTPT